MLEVLRPDALRTLYRLTELEKALEVGDIAAFYRARPQLAYPVR
ncbi:hypothetical protein [Streptomyces sp. SID12501]|nr:hypothetical protein [Streptomyces sp. SID12501]